MPSPETEMHSSYPTRQRIDACKARLKKTIKQMMKPDDLDDYLANWVALGELTAEHGLQVFGKDATLTFIKEMGGLVNGQASAWLNR